MIKCTALLTVCLAYEIDATHTTLEYVSAKVVKPHWNSEKSPSYTSQVTLPRPSEISEKNWST